MASARTALLVLALIAGGCTSSSPSSGTQTRTVLVDYSFDEFATYFLKYFPRRVSVRPGDVVEFKQTWTGEPHSVTMGTLVDEMMELALPFLEKALRGEEIPDEPPPEILEKEKLIPWMFSEDGVAQNGAQPCYLDEGTAPEDKDTPCTREQQRQPPFDGTQSFYNSGFIPYEGSGGNTFRVPIARDTKPGVYNYYCNLHGQFMSGQIEVKSPGEQIPSEDEVTRQARKEIDESSGPLRDVFRKARDGKLAVPAETRNKLSEKHRKLLLARDGTSVGANLSGIPIFDRKVADRVHGGINEFVPRTIRAKAGEPITWANFGGHTISFGVPKYFPIIEVKDDGTVERNPRLDKPAGGSPALPELEHDGGTDPPQPIVVEAGTWSGSGFWSSGMFGWGPVTLYTMAIAKPGRYRYACLVHPPMVGTVVVS